MHDISYTWHKESWILVNIAAPWLVHYLVPQHMFIWNRQHKWSWNNMIEESSRFEIGNLLPAKVKLDIIIKLGSQFEIVLLPAKVNIKFSILELVFFFQQRWNWMWWNWILNLKLVKMDIIIKFLIINLRLSYFQQRCERPLPRRLRTGQANPRSCRTADQQIQTS